MTMINTEKKLMLLSKDLLETIIDAMQLKQEFNGFDRTMDKALETLEQYAESTDSEIYILQALPDALGIDPRRP